MKGVSSRPSPIGLSFWPCLLLVIGLSSLRLCHIHLLWADEDYHLAAAVQLLHGKLPYRDFWYDKPPLTAFYYLLIGGYFGWALRLLDLGYVLLACFLIFRLARAWWGLSEARIAALLLAFFLAFYLPSAVVSFAADALMLAPHLAAIYCALLRRPFLAGLCCAVAFLANAKALFVLAVCCIWLWSDLPLLAFGFLVPLAAAATAAWWTGTWSGYCEQVWRWGWIYATGSPVSRPWAVGFGRTLDWLGFHAALTLGAGYLFLGSQPGIPCKVTRSALPERWTGDRWRLATWLGLSFAAVCLGTRFAPHYFLQLLPPMAVAGSRGIALALKRLARPYFTVFALALLVPAVRFGPRYASLAYDNLLGQAPEWSDITMDLDSRDAARLIRSVAGPKDTLFVWGYRPDIYVYTRLVSPGLFWDSQPLTGVPADRHLHASVPIYGGPAAENRSRFLRSYPVWFVDGLGPLNPRLRPEIYPELRIWLAKNYRAFATTKLTVIYRLKEGGAH